jgi:hypothetical protein
MMASQITKIPRSAAARVRMLTDAARKAGLRPNSVLLRPDGTICVMECELSPLTAANDLFEAWESRL